MADKSTNYMDLRRDYLYCSICGKEHEISDKFCRFCGNSIKKANEISQGKIIAEKKQKSNSLFKRVNDNIRKTKQNMDQRKEEKLKKGYMLMEEITIEINDLLKDFEQDLINKKRFNMELLDDPSNPFLDRPVIRKGFNGTITFFDSYIELLPINEGPTIHINYPEIRKIKNWPLSTLLDPEEFKLSVESEYFWNKLSDVVRINLFLHNGLKYEINVLIGVNGLNFPYWFKENHNQNLFDLIKTYNKKSTQNYKEEFNIFCLNIKNCGTQMEFALKNRFEELFDIKFVSGY